MHKVLITGITGFLGSHIAEILIENNFRVIGLKREGSDIWRCKDFERKIDWVNIDSDGEWKKILIKKAPNVIIHSAWIGVQAADRDNWNEQVKNIEFLVCLLDLGKRLAIDKFIFLGSQAEYGNINGKITEEQPVIALNAYGSIKLASLEIFRTFCELNKINWIWLRLFSLFGEKEGDNWLIPSVVNKMCVSEEMDLTAGEQKYAYLYVKDFSRIICLLLVNEIASGVYNISSNETYRLRDLIEHIRNVVNPEFKLNFGAMPYRNNQSMHVEGDISKIIQQIGPFEFTDFKIAIQNTIKHYKSK